MEKTYQDLATRILAGAAQCKNERFLVALAGPPGSGKTTIANEVVKIINDADRRQAIINKDPSTVHRNPDRAVAALAVAMDGFHLPRATLDKMPNRKEAYVRRGAPWTFDAGATLAFVQQLRVWADKGHSMDSADDVPLTAPSFDHAVKDPVPDGVSIPPSTTIVIIEGIYLLLDEPVWRDIGPLVDLRAFVEIDENVARVRVAKRHVEAGIETSLEDGLARVDSNDTLNGRLIRERLIGSVEAYVRSGNE